jgi:hypothetical protein
MGLDMYLKASKYVSGFDFKEGSQENRHKVMNVMRTAGLPATLISDDSPSVEVQVTVAYWRKANAIHAWFVRECQDGRDECQQTFVTKEKLKELLELCELVLKTKNASLLPPQAGFFFGSTEVDDWYWEDIEGTVKKLKAVLKSPAIDECDLYYQSSW